MKRYFILTMMLLTATISFAQQQKEKEQESSSKTLSFLEKNGTCLIKEFYYFDSVGDVSCEALIITDIVSNSKVGCMRLKTYSATTHSSYIGVLDSDEIDACIKSLDYMKDNLLPTTPEVYTEAIYTTRDKVSIGVFYSRKEWTTFVKTKSYSDYSMKSFSPKYIENLKEQMIKAKGIIEEKTK